MKTLTALIVAAFAALAPLQASANPCSNGADDSVINLQLNVCNNDIDVF
jgi:hypothetical protein